MRFLVMLWLLLGVATAARAQDSTAVRRPGFGDSEWQFALLGVGYGAPVGWYLTAAYAEGTLLALDGRALTLEIGQHGTRLGVGYAYWVEGIGAAARLAVLRTYRHPHWFAPDRTLVGPEIRVAALLAGGLGVFWDVGPRARSRRPLVTYTVSFIL